MRASAAARDPSPARSDHAGGGSGVPSAFAQNSAFARTLTEPFHQLPLGVSQIAGIAQTLPLVAGAVLSGPHKAPRKSVQWIESEAVRAGQAHVPNGSK